MRIHVPSQCIRALVCLGMSGVLAACAVAPRSTERTYSTERHYELACDSASDHIDTLMVHWENIRSNERMPAFQVTQARQAMSVIAPVCDNIGAVQTLDSVRQARVQSAFRTLEYMARDLPRFPAGN